jgi:hypothetical protein
VLSGDRAKDRANAHTAVALASARETRKRAPLQGFSDGASRTRTGDLLGAIQGAHRLNVAVLQGVSGSKRPSTEPKVIRNLREFPGVLARGGIRVAKPPTAFETRAPGAARRLAQFLQTTPLSP